MFDEQELIKLEVVKEEILSQINVHAEGLTKRKDEVLESRKEMWRAARLVVRDFDDVADLYLYAEEVAANERSYEETSKQLLKLKKMLSEPFFARIDFCEEGYDTEKIYIGRQSLFDEGTKSFHVYDWRAPISSLFYDYGVGAASFNVPSNGTSGAEGANISGEITLKRQFEILKGELLFLFDNDIAIEDDILRRELSKSADAAIKTIVNTIQTEQNRAIRAEDKNLLVHGPAGSGKTSVGLHRLAYLLYRNRNELNSSKVRIFSPSPVFASYIAGIIPELGEEDVQNLDFATLLRESARDKHKFLSFYQQIEHITTRPQNDERTMWLMHKYSPEFLDELEQFVVKHSPTFEDVFFSTDKLCDGRRLQELYRDRTAAGTLKSKTERVITYVERAYTEYYKANGRAITALFEGIHGDDLTDHEVRMKYEEEKSIVMRDLKNRLRPASSRLLQRFIKSYAKKTGLSHSYARQALDAEKLYYEDALLLFYTDILSGQVLPDKNVKHILLDEAQDLSHLHHRILNKLYTASHFTVLADANQALYSGSLHSIDELKSLYPSAKDIPLTKSYRSTYEINAFAAQFLASPNTEAHFTRHGPEPEIVENQTIADILQTIPAEYKTVGILLPSVKDATQFHAQLSIKNVQLIASEEDEFQPGVMVMAVPFAKGLEFDCVICPHFGSEKFEGELGNRLMYLICTRALHRLILVK